MTPNNIEKPSTESEPSAARCAVASGSAAPRGIEEYIDWKTQHDKREDLFQSDESGGLHFPCNACQHATKPASFCRACKHYAL